MTLLNDLQLANTKAKLAELQQRYEEITTCSEDSGRVRELNARSYKRLINQLIEEIAVYNAHHHPTHTTAAAK